MLAMALGKVYGTYKLQITNLDKHLSKFLFSFKIVRKNIKKIREIFVLFYIFKENMLTDRTTIKS